VNSYTNHKPLTIAGIFLGLGLGGFFDGIVLHQILQWHHMLTEQYPPSSVENLQLNTLWDGLFHASTWIFTAIGLFLLWRAVARKGIPFSGRWLIGAMLIGWGLFNVVEGIVDHHILQIHHVRPGLDQAFWDIAFLVWGALMLLGGILLTRSQQEPSRISTGEQVYDLPR
jgi:uncharacterized membrane protein